VQARSLRAFAMTQRYCLQREAILADESPYAGRVLQVTVNTREQIDNTFSVSYF